MSVIFLDKFGFHPRNYNLTLIVQLIFYFLKYNHRRSFVTRESNLKKMIFFKKTLYHLAYFSLTAKFYKDNLNIIKLLCIYSSEDRYNYIKY